MRRLLLTIFLINICLAWAQQTYIPLFADTSVIHLTLQVALKPLLKDTDDEGREYHQAMLLIGEEQDSLPVRVKARGNYRRDICRMPPLKLNFKKKQTRGTVFDGVDKIKMVLPCRWNTEQYNTLIQLEYLVYRLYNVLTDSGFQVRPLHLRIEDTQGKREPFEQFAFFIEPLDVLSERLEGTEMEVENVHPNATQTELTTVMSIFQFMVGNTDWSIPGLHNIKLVKPDSSFLPLAIPYDFDFCGLVNASYAKPNPQLGITSVRQRVYRGLCRPEAEMNRVYTRFRDKKEALYAEVDLIPGLSDAKCKQIKAYLDDFYEVLENDRRREFSFEKSCRN